MHRVWLVAAVAAAAVVVAAAETETNKTSTSPASPVTGGPGASLGNAGHGKTGKSGHGTLSRSGGHVEAAEVKRIGIPVNIGHGKVSGDGSGGGHVVEAKLTGHGLFDLAEGHGRVTNLGHWAPLRSAGHRLSLGHGVTGGYTVTAGHGVKLSSSVHGGIGHARPISSPKIPGIFTNVGQREKKDITPPKILKTATPFGNVGQREEGDTGHITPPRTLRPTSPLGNVGQSKEGDFGFSTPRPLKVTSPLGNVEQKEDEETGYITPRPLKITSPLAIVDHSAERNIGTSGPITPPKSNSPFRNVEVKTKGGLGHLTSPPISEDGEVYKGTGHGGDRRSSNRFEDQEGLTGGERRIRNSPSDLYRAARIAATLDRTIPVDLKKLSKVEQDMLLGLTSYGRISREAVLGLLRRGKERSRSIEVSIGSSKGRDSHESQERSIGHHGKDRSRELFKGLEDIKDIIELNHEAKKGDDIELDIGKGSGEKQYDVHVSKGNSAELYEDKEKGFRLFGHHRNKGDSREFHDDRRKGLGLFGLHRNKGDSREFHDDRRKGLGLFGLHRNKGDSRELHDDRRKGLGLFGLHRNKGDSRELYDDRRKGLGLFGLHRNKGDSRELHDDRRKGLGLFGLHRNKGDSGELHGGGGKGLGLFGLHRNKGDSGELYDDSRKGSGLFGLHSRIKGRHSGERSKAGGLFDRSRESIKAESIELRHKGESGLYEDRRKGSGGLLGLFSKGRSDERSRELYGGGGRNRFDIFGLFNNDQSREDISFLDLIKDGREILDEIGDELDIFGLFDDSRELDPLGFFDRNGKILLDSYHKKDLSKEHLIGDLLRNKAIRTLGHGGAGLDVDILGLLDKGSKVKQGILKGHSIERSDSKLISKGSGSKEKSESTVDHKDDSKEGSSATFQHRINNNNNNHHHHNNNISFFHKLKHLYEKIF
ncbi:uncharacterized protein LOC127008028 isoform X2 [Eriocheir sinensis]|uniref:uncharacterized protein LOC127008028 isoform X2 n=1 Tax=Eriocheir sinensis TaxID=95602 RepID=UPI0021C8C82A|nr:uncharacterized protein LOC127008028 isoform X2 [Eriocheir sinensis]